MNIVRTHITKTSPIGYSVAWLGACVGMTGADERRVQRSLEAQFNDRNDDPGAPEQRT